MRVKSVKSIQNVLNEAETYLSNMLEEDLISISKSAYSQAREKIRYEAFIELCNDIKEQFYKEYDYEKYKGFRLSTYPKLNSKSLETMALASLIQD